MTITFNSGEIRTERYGIGEGNREPRKKRGRTDPVRKRLRRRSNGDRSVKPV